MAQVKQTGKHKFNFVDAVILIIILAVAAAAALLAANGMFSKDNDTLEMEYVLEFRSVRDEFLDCFKTGAEVVDASKKYQLGSVIAVSSAPTTFTGTNTVEGKLVYSDYPEHSDVSLTVRTTASLNSENQYILDGGYHLSVGSVVYVRTPDYTGTAYCTQIKITEAK